MSKLIIDMPMPKRCGVCKCRHVEFDIDRVAVFCAIMDNRFVKDYDSIPSWCPIKGVLPDEHGDLVDRDALILELLDCGIDGVQTDELAEFQQIVMDAKAVIAAERKDDGTID